jgi:hypothetical protein
VGGGVDLTHSSGGRPRPAPRCPGTTPNPATCSLPQPDQTRRDLPGAGPVGATRPDRRPGEDRRVFQYLSSATPAWTAAPPRSAATRGGGDCPAPRSHDRAHSSDSGQPGPKLEGGDERFPSGPDRGDDRKPDPSPPRPKPAPAGLTALGLATVLILSSFVASVDSAPTRRTVLARGFRTATVPGHTRAGLSPVSSEEEAAAGPGWNSPSPCGRGPFWTTTVQVDGRPSPRRPRGSGGNIPGLRPVLLHLHVISWTNVGAWRELPATRQRELAAGPG